MNAALKPYLTDAELAEICAGVVTPAAQRRWLARQGVHYIEKPNGRPLVMRSELERVAGAARLGQGDGAVRGEAHNAAAGPNIVGMSSWAAQRKTRDGTQTKRR